MRRKVAGRVLWIARYTRPDGKRAYWKPDWNQDRATFRHRRDAQRAIDEAHDYHDRYRWDVPGTVGAYFETWTARHPRSERTNATNEHRVGRVLDVELEGRRFSDWGLRELRRRHALALADHMLVEQGRTVSGVLNILRSLSAMAEDAITDDLAEINPFKGVKLRATDPRSRKKPRPVRVFSFDEMHAFAAGARPEPRKALGLPPYDYEPMIRTFTDTGMRLGEVLPLRREDFDGEIFVVQRTAHEGALIEGTKTDHGERSAGRVVPCPPSLAKLILEMPRRIDTNLLFPTATGKLWRDRNFYRDVWYRAQDASQLDIRPHECRHSYVTHLRAAGIDDADLAEIAGHRVETMLARYTHPLRRSFERVKRVIG